MMLNPIIKIEVQRGVYIIDLMETTAIEAELDLLTIHITSGEIVSIRFGFDEIEKMVALVQDLYTTWRGIRQEIMDNLIDPS